jgi:hypothetical protein
MTTPAARDARIVNLQTELLDHSGHVNPGLTPARRAELVAEIDALRAANGWRPLDMTGRADPDPVGAAAHAVWDALDLATVAADRDPEAPATLEVAGDVIDVGDGTWGLLAVWGTTPVRITVEHARPEEAEALGMDGNAHHPEPSTFGDHVPHAMRDKLARWHLDDPGDDTEAAPDPAEAAATAADPGGPYRVTGITEPGRQYVTLVSGASWEFAGRVAASATRPGEDYATANISDDHGVIRATYNYGQLAPGGSGPIRDARGGAR